MSKSASGAKKYYCEQYYQEGSLTPLAYYSEHDETIGTWGGKAAMALRLTGEIRRQDFIHLCDNRNPHTLGKLTGRNDTDRTVGYDFTFNASKSVSLAYALGNEADKKTILAAFHQSVRETMTEIETGMQTRVRVKRQNENRMTGNIVYGAFTHFTTRPVDGVPDPHLHSHCFVFNATYDLEDKKWKAGQFQQINQDAPYYEAVFHSKLAHHLGHAGYDIRRTKSGFELAGIEKHTLDKFSRRTQEIEEYSREHQITDDKQKSKVGARTREAKRPLLSTVNQEMEWFSRLSSEELQTVLNLKKEPSTPKEEGAARNAWRFSLAHHLERKSVASDKEILTTAIKSSIGGTTPEQIKREFENDSSILSANERLRTFITTKDALREEKELVRHCIESRNRFAPLHENYIPQNPQLNEQQLVAVRHALTSTDGIILITGKAGTGKTTLMHEVMTGIQQRGKQIYSFAPSSEASRNVQRSEGFDNADTVARLIVDQQLQSTLKHQVIWIDEAGMLSNRDMNQVLSIANAQGARIILTGDTRQHSSVERGDALRIVQQETGIKPVTVNKIQRQKNADYRQAVEWLSGGQTEKGFKKLNQMGVIHEVADSQERIEAITEDYYRCAYGYRHSPPKEVLVVAPTHTEGDRITASIRERLKAQQILGTEERSFTILKNRQLTEAEKQQPENYRAGDVLIFHQNSKGIKAGKKLAIAHAGQDGVFAKDVNGTQYTVTISEAKKYTLYEPRQLHLAQGDKIRITANGKSREGKNLFNGSGFQIEKFDKEGNIVLSNGATLGPDFGHFHFGYVSTSHASQGKTADKVILSQSSATFRASSMEQFYVSVSRGRQAISIYTDDKEDLLHVVSQSSQRKSATELLANQQQQENSIPLLRRWQEKAAGHYHHLTNRFRENGLQTAPRTEQEHSR